MTEAERRVRQAAVAGRTVASVQFSRPMPGFYSSPFLLAASVLLLVRLRSRG
jgi:hypothetical protein